MADIELVIKILEDTYRRIQALVRDDYFEHDICGRSMQRIANGTPLPKGHGRLIDADWVLNKMSTTDAQPITPNKHYAWGFAETLFRNAPTTIEADKEQTDETISGNTRSNL